MEWTAGYAYKEGDTFTVVGRYKRRTFWQWLTNKPRELQQYKVIGGTSFVSGGIVRYDLLNR